MKAAKIYLALLIIAVLVLPTSNVGSKRVYAAAEITKTCVSPDPLEDCEWYYSSENIRVNEDAEELTLGFTSSYEAIKNCGDGDTYIIYKAPDGYKFSNCTAEGIFIDKTSELNFYAYTDTAMQKEYKLNSKRKTVGAARVAWCYDKWSVTLLPDYTKYLKIVLPAGKSWGRHINNIMLEAVPEGETLCQSPYIDEFTGTIENDRYIAKISSNSYFGSWGKGEGNMWGGGYTGRYAVFQCPPDAKLSGVSFTMYTALKDDVAELSVCNTIDGEYIKIPYTVEKTSLGQAWYRYDCSINKMPHNSKYIKVRMKDVASDQDWIHYLDNITLSWVSEDEEIEEMTYAEYGGMNLKRPNRPKTDSDPFVFEDYLGELIYMAPENMKISSVSVTSDSEPSMLATDIYESGVFKTAKLTNIGENTYECSELPFNSQYIKFPGDQVSDVKMQFCDENDVIAASETIESKKLWYFFESDYLVDYNGVETTSFSTSVSPFNAMDGALVPVDESDGENSYVIFSAPDNSVITDFALYVRDESDFGINVFGSDIQGGIYTQIDVNADKVTGPYKKVYSSDGVVGYKYLKLCFGECNSEDRMKNKLVSYSFTWNGCPKFGMQGDGYYTVNIDNADEQQEITGWGVFPYVGSRISYEDNERLTKAVFNDLGETIIRFELYANYDAKTGTLNESSLSSTLELIESAKKAGIEYMFTIWSPPANMKSNGLISGYNSDLSNAYLLEEYEDDFADYIVKTMQFIQERTGTLPSALSIQNEPEGPTGYQSCPYTDEQYNRVFNLVADALESAGLEDITLVGAEPSTFKKVVARWFGTQWENLPDRLGAVVYHGYSDNYTQKYDLLFDRLNGRELWQTEFCDTATTYSNQKYIANAIGSINQNSQFFRSNRWFWWSAYADTDEGAFQSLIYKNADGDYRVNNRYRLLNHIYKSVRPGSHVVPLTVTDKKLLHELNTDGAKSDLGAFKTAEGNVVTIVNSSDVRSTYTVTGVNGDSAIVYRYVGDSADEISEFVEVVDGRVGDIVLESGESAIIITGQNMYVDYFVNRLEGNVNIKINEKLISEYENPMIIRVVKSNNSLISVCTYSLTDLNNFNFEIDIPDEDEGSLELYIWDMPSLYPIFNLKI